MQLCTKVPAKNRSLFYFNLAIFEAVMMGPGSRKQHGGTAAVRLCAVTHC